MQAAKDEGQSEKIVADKMLKETIERLVNAIMLKYFAEV